MCGILAKELKKTFSLLLRISHRVQEEHIVNFTHTWLGQLQALIFSFSWLSISTRKRTGFLQLVGWEEHVIFRADKIFSGAIPIFIFFILQCQEKQILRQEYHQRRHQ